MGRAFWRFCLSIAKTLPHYRSVIKKGYPWSSLAWCELGYLHLEDRQFVKPQHKFCIDCLNPLNVILQCISQHRTVVSDIISQAVLQTSYKDWPTDKMFTKFFDIIKTYTHEVSHNSPKESDQRRSFHPFFREMQSFTLPKSELL